MANYKRTRDIIEMIFKHVTDVLIRMTPLHVATHQAMINLHDSDIKKSYPIEWGYI